MFIRRAVVWLSTIVVAVVVALAVPVAQLRTSSIIETCCCPDPTQCHCPDHEPDSPSQRSIRACHNSERVVVAPELPVFRAAVVAVEVVPVIALLALDPALAAPHPAPPPRRPEAPS